MATNSEAEEDRFIANYEEFVIIHTDALIDINC